MMWKESVLKFAHLLAHLLADYLSCFIITESKSSKNKSRILIDGQKAFFLL